MLYRCPDNQRHEGDVVGCGHVFEGEPDGEGNIDCPNCGMWFEHRQGSIPERLEYLRGELRAERISMGELIELQGLAEHIEASDVELLEAAGVPEFDEEGRHATVRCDATDHRGHQCVYRLGHSSEFAHRYEGVTG